MKENEKRRKKRRRRGGMWDVEKGEGRGVEGTRRVGRGAKGRNL